MADDFTDDSIAVEDAPDFSTESVAVEDSRAEFGNLPPLEPISRRRLLEVEQAEARQEISPFTELLAADEPLIPAPSPSEAAALMSPIGLRLRPFRQPSGPVAEAVFEAGRTVAQMPADITRPTMLPLAPLAFAPIPGAPALRHAIPKAMGILFGGETIGHGTADVVSGIEEEDPKLIGRGIGELTIGGMLSAPVVGGAVRPLTLPRSVEALRESGVEVPQFIQAKVQPGERAGIAIPSVTEAQRFPIAPRELQRPRVTVPETPAEIPTQGVGQYPPEQMPTLSRLQTSRNVAAFRRQAKAAEQTQTRVEAQPIAPSAPLPELHPTSAGLIDAILSTASGKDIPLNQLYGALEAAPTAKRILEGHIVRLEASGASEAQTGLFYDALTKIEGFENTYAEAITKPPPQRGRAKRTDVLPPEPPPEPGGTPVPKPPTKPVGGPSASIDPQAAKVYEPVSPKPGESKQAVPAEESGLRVPPSEEARAEVPLTDPVGNAPEFYSLPRLRALDRSKDLKLAAAKKYYGAKTVPELARLAKARFDEMAAKAKPLETREDAEMKRVQALPEGPEGEAQLVAEDIAKAVETVDVTDVAGFSPVPALVRIIRRAARDPAMKTAAEQAMQKIGAAAREQGVPLDTIKQEIAGELKAIYGADAAEMAKAFFGEETPAPKGVYPTWATPELAAAIKRAQFQKPGEFKPFPEWEKASVEQQRLLLSSAFDFKRENGQIMIAPKASAEKRMGQIKFTELPAPEAPKAPEPALPAPAATAETAADFASKLDAYSPADRLIIQRTIETNANNPLLSAWKREWLRVNAIRREASAGPKALAVGESAKAGPTTRSGPPPAKAEEGARETATHPPAIERIVATAVRNPSTGQIASAPNKIHVQLYNEVGLDPTRLSSKQVAESSGYMTDRGRFVTQDEGQRLAQEAKQIGAREELMGEVVRERLSKTAAQPKTPAPVAVAKAQAEVPDVVVQTKAIATGKKSRWVRRNGLWYKATTLTGALTTQKTPLEAGIGLAKGLDEIALNPKPWQRVRQLEKTEPSAEPPIPPGPGAASPSEFAERTAKGAGAQPPTPPPSATIDASATPSPEIARRAKDFNIFNKANSGQWTFYFGKLGEAAKSAWDKMTLSAFKIREDIGRDVQRYADNLLSRLPRPIRKNGGRVFFDALDGKPLDQIEAEWRGRPHGDAVIAAAGEIKTRLEEIRTTIRDAKREAYHGFLMGLDRPTLAQLFDNNISRAVDTSKYPKEMFADALTRNEFPDDWGIADGSYLTHLFTGDWKVSVSRGETTEFVTRAKTVAEAKIRVREYVRNNPDYANADWKIEQDTVIPADMIRLGDRRFWQLVQQMKDNLGVSASEIKQAQQGIIGRKASKQKWFGSLQQRRGFQGYSHDYRQVITAYLSGFHRWLELTKLQREVQPLIEQVRREGRTSAAEQLDILMDNLWGKPAQSTVLFDNFIREVPGVRDYIKPLALERWSRNIRSTLAFLTLKTGRFAVVNRLQPLQGLYPLVGERIMAQAKIRQHTAEGRALLDEAGVRFDPGQYGGEATGVKSTLRNIGERISGERSNQELAFLAMFQHGIESGLSRAEAINYAKLRGQLLTQFTPVITDIPPIMRGPITGLLFQFKRFPIKQAELLFKMVAQRQFGGLARWLGVMAAAGGLSYFMRQFLFPSDKRERLRRSITQQHGQAVADAVMYGAPGLMNVDLSGSLVLGEEPFGANIYEKVGRQVTGPAVSLTAEGIKAALTEPRESTTALQKAITMLRRFPTLKPIAELIALEQSDLDVRTPDGEVKYRKAVNDAVVGIGAFRTANEANMQSAVNAIVELKRQTTELKNAAYVAAISNGNIEPALEAIQKFNERWPEVAISSKELNEYIHTRAKASGKTDYERQAGKKFAPLLPEQP